MSEPRSSSKGCCVYVSRGADFAIVAPVFNLDGLRVEVPGFASRLSRVDVEAIGETLVRGLHVVPADESTRSAALAHGARKKTWPAFVASGVRSVEAFESAYVRLFVTGANESDLVWVVEGPELFNGCRLQSSMRSRAASAELGRWIVEFADFVIEVEEKTTRR
jgi:hypothetical protein